MPDRFPFVLAAVLFYAACARADLANELKGSFDGLLINSTPVGQYATQRRGVIAGGSVSIRNQMMNPKLISFVPPSFHGGCNGIDLYGGSFSFINGAQFTQMLRGIAQAAAGYAFHLAIEGMCPTCNQVMTKLQKDVSFINSLMKDSCEFAELGVNALNDATGFSSWGKLIPELSVDIGTEQGFIEDWYYGKKKSTESPEATILKQGGEKEKEKITGNVVWQALQKSDAAKWFANGDKAMLEAMMSLTGTVILQPRADKSGVDYEFRQRKITTKDLIEGGNLTVYKCESDACLLPPGNDTQVLKDQEGLRAKARNMIFGSDEDVLRNGGILGKVYARGDGGFSELEINFIRSDRAAILGMIRKLQSERNMAKHYAEQAIEVIVTELAAAFEEEIIWNVTAAVKNSGVKLDSVALGAFRDLHQEVIEARRINGQALAGISTLLTMETNLVQSLREKNYVKNQ